MSDKRIKVPGYVQRQLFTNGIEYRNFSPDLVGFQIASEGGTPLFTMGNFNITTNMEPKSDKFFNTSSFSNFVSLTDLDATLLNLNSVLRTRNGVILNLDNFDINYYAQFGSLSEFVRVSLENIIINWPASLYINKTYIDEIGNITNGLTVENYSYNLLTDTASFKINTTFIDNKFQLNILSNGDLLNSFNVTNDLRNVSANYLSYVILNNEIEYPVVGFTGATYNTNDYVYFSVKGNPFSGISSNISYHIKPNKLKEDTFFKTIPDFEKYLLNRLVTPKYTATFNYTTKSELGMVIHASESLTWPTTDGYNIDFETSEYVDYATKLLDIATGSDLTSSDLMNRYLVSESISSFDTAPIVFDSLNQDQTGQKVTKTLRIYGVNFDELNNYIEGISFANTVTYNKQNNTPDAYLKNLARVLGWELVSSVIENGLLASYVSTDKSSYSGQSRSLTPVEADIELWRRLILNSPWLWKSKGTRKAIEFLIKFIGAPLGLISFNEYVYKTDGPIDVELFKKVLELNGLDKDDLSIYPIDSDGYPTPLKNTPQMYFQNFGLWYRETGGTGSTHDILTGNNPHLGPYDGGYEYIHQFKSLIPNFSSVTITSSTETIDNVKLFTNYNIGEITNYSGETYVSASYDDGSDIKDCVVVTSSIIPDPNPQPTTNDCGCSPLEDDDSLSICVKRLIPTTPVLCANVYGTPQYTARLGSLEFSYKQYDINGVEIIIDGEQFTKTSIYATKECCKANGGSPTIYSEVNRATSEVVNSGYICCKTSYCSCRIAEGWLPIFDPIKLPLAINRHIGVQVGNYIEFIKLDGSLGVVTPTGAHCLSGVNRYTIPTSITDPYTGEKGLGCRLTDNGLADLALGTNGKMYEVYLGAYNGSKSVCGGIA